jgi:hypothetical protein
VLVQRLVHLTMVGRLFTTIVYQCCCFFYSSINTRIIPKVYTHMFRRFSCLQCVLARRKECSFFTLHLLNATCTIAPVVVPTITTDRRIPPRTPHAPYHPHNPRRRCTIQQRRNDPPPHMPPHVPPRMLPRQNPNAGNTAAASFHHL